MNKISFIHTHYFPTKLLKSVDIDTSVVALEVYPDLLSKYYGDYDILRDLFGGIGLLFDCDADVV